MCFFELSEAAGISRADAIKRLAALGSPPCSSAALRPVRRPPGQRRLGDDRAGRSYGLRRRRALRRERRYDRAAGRPHRRRRPIYQRHDSQRRAAHRTPRQVRASRPHRLARSLLPVGRTVHAAGHDRSAIGAAVHRRARVDRRASRRHVRALPARRDHLGKRRRRTFLELRRAARAPRGPPPARLPPPVRSSPASTDRSLLAARRPRRSG